MQADGVLKVIVRKLGCMGIQGPFNGYQLHNFTTFTDTMCIYTVLLVVSKPVVNSETVGKVQKWRI